MFRKKQSKKKADKDVIKWRGHEILRIEAFSDAVFGFALTLLIVSLEVPKNFEELWNMMKGFLPFGVCFILVFQIWMAQNLFFRRYGLHDERTLVLNAFLLFTTLVFMFPLKFLWSTIFPSARVNTSDAHEFVKLFYLYGACFATVYFLFALMYAHAYAKREKLKLTDSEAFETKTYIYRHTGVGMVAVLSLILASFGPRFLGYAGVSYCLIGLVIAMTHSRRAKIHRKKYGRGLDDEVIVSYALDTPVGEKVKTE